MGTRIWIETPVEALQALKIYRPVNGRLIKAVGAVKLDRLAFYATKDGRMCVALPTPVKCQISLTNYTNTQIAKAARLLKRISFADYEAHEEARVKAAREQHVAWRVRLLSARLKRSA